MSYNIENNTYILGLPLLWCPTTYNNSNLEWLVFDTIEPNMLNHNELNDYDQLFKQSLYQIKETGIRQNWPKKYIKNYINYIKNHTINIEILKIYYLEDNSMVCIIKTYWIRYFIRLCKNKMIYFNKVINHRKKLKHIQYYNINGKWPKY